MTSTNLDLNKMGLAPMTSLEMQEVVGGVLAINIGKIITAAVGAAVAVYNFVAGK